MDLRTGKDYKWKSSPRMRTKCANAARLYARLIEAMQVAKVADHSGGPGVADLPDNKVYRIAQPKRYSQIGYFSLIDRSCSIQPLAVWSRNLKGLKRRGLQDGVRGKKLRIFSPGNDWRACV
jgi:hypothetical protein